MTHPDIATGLAADRARELRATATRSRLAALARCCRPSWIAETTQRLRSRFAERRALRTAATPARCCA